MHQAFQRLIDWSLNETCQDVCAVITGPNGFYKKHRIKASRDFDWIESKESVSEASLRLRSDPTRWLCIQPNFHFRFLHSQFLDKIASQSTNLRPLCCTN